MNCDNVFGCDSPAEWEFVYANECTCNPNYMVFCTPCKDDLVWAYGLESTEEAIITRGCTTCLKPIVTPVISAL